MDWLSIRTIGSFRVRSYFFGGETPNQTPPMGDGTSWVKEPRASRLIKRQGVPHFTGVVEL